MAQLIDTPNGPMLCSRINAGSATRGDTLVSPDGQRMFRIADVRPEFDSGQVQLKVTGSYTNWWVRVGLNTPVWRAVGARAGGTI